MKSKWGVVLWCNTLISYRKEKTLKKDYNHDTYEIFSNVNKVVRDSSVAPSAFSKIENQGMVGKVASSVGGNLIENPLHKATYSAVGVFYDRKKHKPYLGSVLYTVFKWGLLLILAACPPLLILVVATGLLGKVKKLLK